MEHKLHPAKQINSFSKAERIHSKKQIEELFREGSYFYLYPFKVFYLFVEQSVPKHAVLISVPKRNFKKAVDRNRIKRQIKEAYRIQKHILLKDASYTLQIAYIYTAKQKIQYNVVHSKLLKTLQRLMKESPKTLKNKGNEDI